MNASLKAFEIPLQLCGTPARQRVDDPVLTPFGCDHIAAPEVSEVLRDVRLWLAQNFLKVAHAERRLRQQMQNPKPSPVTKTLIDLYQVHLSGQQHAVTALVLSEQPLSTPHFSFARQAVRFVVRAKSIERSVTTADAIGNCEMA